MLLAQTISIVAPAVVIIGTYLLHRALPMYRHETVSHHVARERKLFLRAAVVMSIVSPFYYGLILLWLAPAYQLHAGIVMIGILGLCGQYIALWTPLIGKYSRVHTFGAILVGITMIAVAAGLLASPVAPLHITIASWLFIVLTPALALLSRWQHHILLSEVLFAVSFYVLVVVATLSV